MAKHKWIGMQVYCFVDNFEALVEPVIQVINGVEDHFCFHNPQTNKYPFNGFPPPIGPGIPLLSSVTELSSKTASARRSRVF